MAFGRKSFFKPTPAGIMFWSDVYMAMAGQFIGWIKTTDLVSHRFGDVSSEILGQTLMYVIIGRKFFGVDTNKKNIPVDQVSVIDTTDPKIKFLFWFIVTQAFLMM
jgi:hypothetical protein